MVLLSSREVESASGQAEVAAAPDVASVPRQLIVFCDGTNNNVTGAGRDTNVVLMQHCLTGDDEQFVFYDPGVGNAGTTPSATLWERARDTSQRLIGLAFGAGVFDNMAECYAFLMRNYRQGDEIYLFGFSRGAFTARALSGLVNEFGLLRAGQENLIPTLLHVYFLDQSTPERKAARSRQIVDLKKLFVPADRREVWIHLVGVWDTVASIGLWPFDRTITNDPTFVDKRYRHVRHALARDELRATFKPRLYGVEDGPHPYPSVAAPQPGIMHDIVQQWFPGAHCDVGGGYVSSEAGLSRRTLRWMLEEAEQCGLRLSKQAVAEHTQATPGVSEMVHAEPYLQPLWALAGLSQRFDKRANVPQAGPSLQFPSDTVWAVGSTLQRLVLGVVAYLLLVIATAAALTGHLSTDVAQLLPAWGALAAWHQWPFVDYVFSWQGTGVYPRTALLLETVSASAALYLVAVASSWAYAWGIRLRPPADKANTWRARIGGAPKWLTVCVVLNHGAALAAALSSSWAWDWVTSLFAGVMVFAWYGQWLALAAVLSLLMWGVVSRLRG